MLATAGPISALAARKAAMYDKKQDPWWAVTYGDMAVVMNAVDRGNLSVTAVDYGGNTVLSIACREGYVEIVQALMEGGVSIKRTSDSPYKLNTLAAIPCDANHGNNAGDTPLLLALSPPGARKAERWGEDWDFDTYLRPATGEEEQLELISILVSFGADVNKPNRRGVTPVMKATRMKWKSAVDYLIRSGARVNDRDYKRSTPLHAAIKLRSVALAQRLLQAGADLTIRDRHGYTPAMAAVVSGSKKMARLITSYRASLDTPDYNHVTPLTYACTVGDVELVHHLLLAGARRDERAIARLTDNQQELLRQALLAVNWGRGVENPASKERLQVPAAKSIKAIPMFASLSIPETSSIANNLCIPKYYEPGEVLFAQGEQMKRFYWLREGFLEFKVERPNGDVERYNLTPEDKYPFFGELCLVSRYISPATVTVIRDVTTKLLVLDPVNLEELLLTTQATAPLFISKQQALRERKALRRAIANRGVVEEPPAWAVISDDPRLWLRPYLPPAPLKSITMDELATSSSAVATVPTAKSSAKLAKSGTTAKGASGAVVPGTQSAAAASRAVEVESKQEAAVDAEQSDDTHSDEGSSLASDDDSDEDEDDDEEDDEEDEEEEEEGDDGEDEDDGVVESKGSDSSPAIGSSSPMKLRGRLRSQSSSASSLMQSHRSATGMQSPGRSARLSEQSPGRSGRVSDQSPGRSSRRSDQSQGRPAQSPGRSGQSPGQSARSGGTGAGSMASRSSPAASSSRRVSHNVAP